MVPRWLPKIRHHIFIQVKGKGKDNVRRICSKSESFPQASFPFQQFSPYTSLTGIESDDRPYLQGRPENHETQFSWLAETNCLGLGIMPLRNKLSIVNKDAGGNILSRKLWKARNWPIYQICKNVYILERICLIDTQSFICQVFSREHWV